MNEIIKSNYVSNPTGKFISLAAAFASAYTLMRSGTNVQYLGSARQSMIEREGMVDSYSVNAGTYDAEAPVLSDVANWWRLRGIDIRDGTRQFNAACQSAFFWLGDSLVPLTALVASLGFGFNKEIAAGLEATKKYLPDTNWGHLIEQTFTGAAKLTGHAAGATLAGIRMVTDKAVKLTQRSPIAAGVLGLLTFMTGAKFINVLNGDNQRGTLRDDFTKFYH